MVERQHSSDDRSLAPFSQETLQELKSLGLELEDVETVGKSRNWIQNRVLSVIGDKNERRVINLAKRIKAEKSAYIKTMQKKLSSLNYKYILRSYTEMCGDSIEKWQFIEQFICNNGRDDYTVLLELKELYETDIEKLEKVAEIVSKVSWYGAQTLPELKELYETDIEKLEKVAEIIANIPNANVGSVCNTLLQLKELYETDIGEFGKVAEIVANVGRQGGTAACHALLELKELYETDIEKLEKVAEIVSKVSDYGDQTLPELKELYETDIEKLEKVAEIVANVGRQGYNALPELKELYGADIEKFKAVAEIVANVGRQGGTAACDAITQLEQLHQNSFSNLQILGDVVIDIHKRFGERILKELVKYKEVYGNDITKLEKASKYAELTRIFDKTVLEKYIAIFEEEGEEKAEEYLNGLPLQAKGLIVSTVPESHRGLSEYQYLVRYVFPDGNYSNHEKNLNCGDKLEHLEGYEFDREGYPIVLTGLLGYKIKEGMQPNKDLLIAYQDRLDKIRQFVCSRGPDNEALQKAFEAKVDAIFTEKAWSEHQNIEGLTLKEKMLCLFLREATRKKEKSKSFEPDLDIYDLIVEYKYAFHEDLEAYVARSADSVKIYSDEPSQNYMLLAELSVIYGENIKHVLRHNIFEELENSDNYNRIVEMFAEKLGEGGAEKEFNPKQWDRIEGTFNNTHIPNQGQTITVVNATTGEEETKYKKGKYEVLYQQIYGIISSNITFDTEEQKQEFEEKLKTIFSELKANLTVEKLKELMPRFYKLRALYRSSINTKLAELFSYDINQIFRELAKYEENVEVEEKETSINGQQSKVVNKSTKKRNIRGFFTKTAETANARMGAYLCIAGDPSMWENENYFELVMVDEDTNKCVGVVMFIKIQTEDGKKYLWFGPNPFESFLEVVGSSACYKYLYETACTFANDNNFDGIVVPSKDEQILGQCTNRGGDFPGLIKASRLRDAKGNLAIVQFGKKHTLGGGYGYEDGALIWKKGQTS